MPVLNQHHVNHFIDLSHGDVGGGHHQGEETRDRFVLEFDALGIEGYTDIGRTEYVARYPDPPPHSTSPRCTFSSVCDSSP